ncbi:RE2 [Symbiodinium sp. CCMP2592]|nr:RE2 [Symbiodinium sp. CCMP2592]
MNSGDKDSSWLKCQWNGDPGGWADFLRCVRLAFEKTSRRKRHLLGPEIVGQLSGRAWVVTQELDHRQLVRRDGVVYLIEFLRDRLCKTPIPDVGLRLEQLMIRLRRHPGTSMATWATQLRDAYRQLQLALARARKGPRTISSPSPTSTPTKTRSSRRTSQGTLEEPHAEEPTEGEQDETETLPGAPDDDELRRDEEVLPSSPASRTSESRPPRRKRRDSDSDDSVKALADLEIWSRCEEKLEEVLPSELLGWLLLRRAGLTAQARLSVQAAAGNSLKLDRVEGALRGMEDELLAQEQTRTPHPAGRRRSFWVEDEGHWSILLADDDDLSESLEGIPTHYVGDENAFNVWAEDEEYGDESWTGSSDGAYWGDEWHGWTPEEDPANILTAEELQQVEEAYQAADSKLRTFVDARKAVRARHLSRGFYPFAPQNKGFRSQKGKGKMRSFPKGKGKGKKGATPTSPVANMSVPVLMSESPTFAVSPGQAGYSGCFICGDRSHQFRDCPRRSTKGPAKGSGKVHFHTEPEVYMVQATPSMATTASSTSPMATRPASSTSPMATTASSTSPMATTASPTSPMVSTATSTSLAMSPASGSSVMFEQRTDVRQVPMVYEDTTVDVPDMILVQKSASGSCMDGFAVLDSGATETVGSLPALESLMLARYEVTSQVEEVAVTNAAPKRFKFGNGSHDMSSSHILLPVTLGTHQVPMGIYTLDVEGVPLLIGIKTLRRLRSVIDCHRDIPVMGAVDPNRGIQLQRSVTGHLLLDLRQDLMVHSFSLLEPRARVASRVLPHREETTYMVQSVEHDEVPASEADASMCSPVPDAALLASDPPSVCALDDEVPVNADAPCIPIAFCFTSSLFMAHRQPEAAAPPPSKSIDKNEEQFVTSGKEAVKAKPKKGGYKSQPLDWDRTVESDPRDPRHSGPPCNGEHVPARMFKGSPSGSNQYGQWTACERCLLRLSYTPRAGCHALHRSPGALPKDVQLAVKEELPNLTTLKDKDIGWAAAEKSAEDNLMRVRQARMSQQAGQRGAAPKRLAQKDLGPKASPATSAPPTSSPTPTSPTSSLGTSTVVVDVEEVNEGMHAHPGRKAVKRNEEAAEELDYALLENEEMIENLAASYVHERAYSMATMENFLKQLRAAHAVPQRKFMDKKTTTSFVVSYGLYAHGSQCGVMNSTFQNPQLCKYVNQWLQAWAPSSAHWTTFSIVYNMESKPHRDLHNLKGQPNYVITFGEHEHGELWLERTPEDSVTGEVRRRKKPNGSLANGQLLSPHHQVISFDADQWHATMPWRGTRIALAAYTARSFRGLDPELRRFFAQWHYMMEDRLWNLLEDTGCICVRELRLHFDTPWHLACSVDSLEDSVVLAEQILPSAVSSDHKRAGALIWGWLRDQTDLLKRVQGRLKTKATRIVAPPCGDVSPGEVYAQLVSGSLELTKQTSRAHARWISSGAGTPADAEKAARKFWGTVLVQIMVEAKLPIVDIPVESEEQRVLYALRALGTRRSKTLRNRARAWRKARDWMLSVKSVAFPRRPSDVVDYLLFLEQEVGTKSCISEFMSALSVLEDAGQVPLASQLCKDRLVVAASKSSEAEVHVGVTSKKQAAPLSVAMLLSLEIFVGFLVKTKTTGPDKKVAEVPFFVGRDVGLSGRDWLRSGFDLWKGFGQLDRTFLVFQSSEDFEEPIFKFAKPEVISNYMRLIWRQLKVPFRKIGEHVWKSRAEGALLGDECYLFWTGHSMRHVLPTIAAVLEVPKERRDYLGRWHIGLHQSSDYIHTCRQIVHDIQRRVCDKLSGGKPGYDEEELFEELREWLRDRGSDPDPWLKLHAVMRTVSGCKVLNQTWPLLADFTDGTDNAAPAPPVSNSSQTDKEKVDPSSSSGESSSTELGIRVPVQRGDSLPQCFQCPFAACCQCYQLRWREQIRCLKWAVFCSVLHVVNLSRHYYTSHSQTFSAPLGLSDFIRSVLSVFSFARLGATMAADPAAQRQFLKDNVDADFIFLLEEHGVDLALQYAIGQHYKSIRTFAAFADDRGAARTAITADFGVRAESAADRARRKLSFGLRHKVLGVQKPLVSSDRAAMRAALEAVRGYSVPESEEPAPEYLAHKLEQIENGEPTASYLDEVISRKESNSLQLQTSLDNQGRLRVMRQKPKGKLPQNTEELRAKIRLEASTWVMLAAKCRGRAYLQGLQLSHFDRFLEYLLGDKCYSMQVASAAPMSSSAHADRHTLSVPWNILLQYEFELRKWAIKEAHRLSAPLGDKLHEATTNTELKELHFTSQVALSRRSTGADPPPPKWPRKGDGKKGEKGGKDKGGKDGKGKADGKIKIGESWFDLVSKTPADVRAWLEVLCTSQNIILEMSEVDICRDPSMDLLDSAVADRCLLQVQNSEWDVVLVTPPCNTFSRARCVQPGPRPLRSRIYPAGFPWLSDSHRAAADNGNQFVSFSFQICTAALSNSIPFLLEHPEDLGMTTTGHTPASIWQLPEAAALFKHEQVVTFAIYQCHYGAHTPKPTRFLSSIAATFGMRFMGPPHLDSADKYLGPLPKYCGHRHSNRLLGAANTAAAAAYPPDLCKAIASWTFSVFDGGGGAPSVATVPESAHCFQFPARELPGKRKRGSADFLIDTEEVATLPEQDDIPFSELKSGCEGPPMVGDFAGSSDEFVDGFGRCSPGRWKPCNRGTTMSAEALDFAQRLKERVRMFVVECVPDLAKSTFRLATGHWNGPLFDQGRLEELREDWFNMLPDPIRAREMIPHQPFYLRAISQTLRILGDPDYRIIEEGKFCFVNGVEVGHTAPLGPVPQVFRIRRKDQKYDESTWQPLMQNYRDGAEVEKALEEAFTKEEAEGRMFPLSLAEAKTRFPGPALRIAAQAVIPKPDHEFRVVHDGTHGVHVNNEIVMLDRLESPGPREISSIQKLGMVAEEKVLFGLVGDVKKAHRRYLHHPEHWGVLACRTRSDSSVVWLNRTGTFGIASAAYWFARLIGLVGRLSLRVMLQAFVFMLIYADDLHLLSGGSDRWLNLWMSLALLCMQGTPFSEKKWRGGLQLDWVGYWIDYGRFKLGISEKRCQWIIRSIEGMEGDGWLVDVRRFHELHGRLGFMSQILIWIRPFLAPGYAWLAVVSKGAVLALPNLIRCTLRFILDRLRAGSRTYPAGLADKDYGELFRTDAACNSDSVVLGGWFLVRGVVCKSAPWFQITLRCEEAPWLFKEGLGSSWASTSAELLSSLVALHLLERDFPEVFSCPGSFRACFAGGTDNKSADAISARLLTTKVPVMFVLMEYAHRCDLAGVRCLLNWRPRDANQEADRITKNDFSDFCPDLRVAVSWSELNFSVLPSLLRFANFQSTLEDARASASGEGQSPSRIRFEKSHVCDDQASPTETSHLSVDEKQAIFNDFEEYQDLLLENCESEDDDARLFGLEICCATASKLRDELQSRGERVQTLGFAEGGDLGTNHGAELVKATILRLRPRWLICHVPLGPTRKNKEDDMSSPPWRRFNKVVRHLLETAQVQIDNGGEVLWCQPAESSARFLSCARVFWYQHQQHADGRVMKCGETHYRSTSTTLLQGLPSVSETPPDLEKTVAKIMQQVIRYEAVFSFVGAVDMSVLEGISSKELGELMERVHRLHSRLGHPSNRLLVKNLQARHADKRLIAAASQLKCDACLESRIKAPRPPVDLSRSDRLWTDLQMDLFQMKIDDRIYHFLLFVDECSGYAVIRLVFDHSVNKGGNATSAQVCHLLEEAWTQYFGFPERIKLDAESALRGTLLRDWCATRGVELVHAPAEHHQFISEVERSIGTLRRKIETFLRERPEHPRQVALSMVTSHNSLARIHGFSPLQWALGRDLSLSGHVNEGTGELPALSSAGTPGADLHQTHRMRLRAAQAFLELRHKELSDRAARSSASAYPHYLPGDLIYYRRYKTPQDLPANMSTDHPRMTISRWYGPARVLATESRGAPGERRPSSHLWVIAQGRLKKCHYTQVRPASETEHLIAQQSSGTTFPWTMSNLTSLLNKGAYEDLTRDRAVYPDDLEFPDEDDRDDGLPPGADEHVGNGDQLTDPLSDEELIPAASSAARKREGPEPVEEEEMVPDNAEIDLNKLFNDPSYMPFQPIPASARVSPYPQGSFREQRARHEQDDRPWHVRRNEGESLYHETEEADKVFAVTIDAPANAQAWKKMVKHPEKFMSKAVSKGVEVSWQRLSAEQRSAMAEAKSLEVAQWVQLKVCKRVAEHVPESQLLRMRWVLTFKEADPTEAGTPQVKAKARIVILGYSDPGLLEDTTASPTMSKLTRQLMLNLACIRRWAIYSADVRTAFLQARPTDRGRRLLAKPLPELAEKLGLTPQECVELTGSAYGLATAPKEWFADVSSTLKKLGALQCRTDPCAWIVLGVDGEVAGALASHVDDFLIMGSATDANWLRFIAAFKAAYTWAPWQQGDFVHCGIRILQHEDGSMTLDHSGFCADLVQMDPAGPGETMTENQVRQAKAILGSAQWRVTQSAPHHAAKLSYLQTLLSSRSSSCVDQINKLVREIHNAKHISISVQNLGDFDPKTATFVAWSDASLANRPDGTSTGGLLVGMMSPKSMELGQGKINVISWRSYKLPRVARSSLSAEAQALSNCEQELMYARLAWFELNGGKVDVNNPAAGTSQVPGHLIIDARGVYDTLMKADPGMASFNVKDKYTSLELMGISENLQSQGTILNWCDSDHQLADGLTKSAKQDVLQKFLLQGHWRLRHPGAFMSAKRRRVLDGNQRLDPSDVQPNVTSTQA